MTKKNVGNFVLDNIKEYMDSRHSEKAYAIKEYDGFYLGYFTDKKSAHMEPIVFTKKTGLPVPKTFASIPLKDCKNPKLIYESGGKKDGKK